jgi:organic radical activating enzyme
MNDNPIAWLEVTDSCNLRCEGCYRQILTGHKSLEKIKEEILFLKRWRNPDNMSIAGGEPLLHPQILDIVAFITEIGIKPILLTNAMHLTPDFLQELKEAGLVGFTIHIDSHQGRPGWKDKNEAENNELRQYYADMVAAEGGLIAVFNSTVYPASYHEIPDVVRWGRANIDRVHGLVFITYRALDTGSHVAYDSEGRAVDANQLGYTSKRIDEAFVTSPEVCQSIKDTCPEYDPAGYLGGTIRHDAFKWLAGAMIGSRRGVYGSIGKETMQLAQIGHHLIFGTYLAYMSKMRVSPLVFLMSPWDKTVREAARNWLRDMFRHPQSLFDGLQLQSIGIIQAPDIQPGGLADMCDGCPDMTVWDGKLINSCRMDEYRLFGDLLSVAQKPKMEVESEPASSGDEDRDVQRK